MNEKIRLPFQLGVDRHNRVAQQGGPVFQSLRNLILDTQDEMVRRKAMNLRQVLAVYATGSFGALLANPPSGCAGSGTPIQPLCLWFPPDSQAGSLGRSFAAVFRSENGTNALLTDGVTRVVTMPKSRRRPQAVEWQGALWIACGAELDGSSYSDAFKYRSKGSGIIRVAPYEAAGTRTISIWQAVPFQCDGTWSSVLYKAFRALHQARCIGVYRGRVVLGNFPADEYGQPRNGYMVMSDGPGDSDGFPDLSSIGVDGVEGRDVPKFQGAIEGLVNESVDDPLTPDSVFDPLVLRNLIVGSEHEDIIGFKELSLMADGSMTNSALLIFKDRSIYLMTGEPLLTSDVGEQTGDAVIAKQPLADGCASFETVCETPWGIIWAGHDDIYFLPNGGGVVIPIGRYIANELQATPYDLRYLWHAAYHEGYYRLSIMAPGQNQADPVAMENTWMLDLRYGPPTDWTKARWFGPQHYQPIITPLVSGDTPIERGTYITAADKRGLYKDELFSLQRGFYSANNGAGGGYAALVLAGLDGEDVRDWCCDFSPTEFIPPGTNLSPALDEKRVVTGGAGDGEASPDSQWAHGRRKKVTTAGDGAGGEPDWTDSGLSTTDGTITWADDGKVAVPATDVDLAAHDGSDGPAGTRGNHILAYLRTLELDGSQKQLLKALRTLQVVASAHQATRWDIRGYGYQLEVADNQKDVDKFGGMVMGATTLGGANSTGMNDATTAFLIALDAEAAMTLGRTVSFGLSEMPGIVIPESMLSFRFWVDVDSDGDPETAFTATLTETKYDGLYELLDAMKDAMATATAVAVPSFGQSLSTSPASSILGGGNVTARITSDSGLMGRKWKPYVGTDTPPGEEAYGTLWAALGFVQVSGVGDANNYYTHTSAFSPANRWASKLRISELEATVRLFKRGPG